ncbi:MAG TPA: hypothetical protein VGH14_07970 [Solirubrobacterales bacterium]|jgi:hypothetical protein
MRRPLAVFLVTVAALAAVAQGAAASPRHGFIFWLHTGGFGIEGRSELGSGRMRLLLDRRGEVAYYYVKARVGAGTVRARFGRLGSLDLRFEPRQDEPPLGCGNSEGWQVGAFHGSIAFRGEHDYARVHARRATGYFQTYPPGSCGRDKRAATASRGRVAATGSRAASAPIGPIAETGAHIGGVTSSRPPTREIYFFTTNGQAGVGAIFDAFRIEQREGMRIDRGAQVSGGARTFDWNLAAGTAVVEPPAPFSGRAVYREGKDGRAPSWTGSLLAPVLGGSPIRLTGPGLHARLLAGTPFS